MIWPNLPAATTIYAHMPRTPLTGDGKGDHFFLPLEQSLQHPYTQFNRTWKGFVIRNTITIDIDEPMALEVFRERAGLEPDLWVLNPHKAMSGHVSLVLPKAVFVPVGAKPRPWFQGIRREAWEVLMLLEEWLVAVCKADKAIVTQKTKTPGHPDHVTYWREGSLRSLGELAEWIDWSRVPQEVPRGTLRAPTGRNDALYMRALYAGCDYAAAGAESVEDVLEHLTARVDALNDFAEPLPLAEVRATLKSAAKRAWARRDTWKPRGTVKQAKPTATREQRTEGTLKRLVDAGRQLVDSGLELAKKALARAAHAGINTVRRYWDRVQSACLQGSTEGDPSSSLLIQRPPTPQPTPEPSAKALEAPSALNAPAQVPNSRKAPVLKTIGMKTRTKGYHMPTYNLRHFTPSHPLPAKECAELLGLPDIPSELCLVANGHLETADGLLILDDVGARKLEAQFAGIVGGRLPMRNSVAPWEMAIRPLSAYGSFRPEVRRSSGRLLELWAVEIKWSLCVWERPGTILTTAPDLNLELSEGRMRIVGIQSFALVNIPAIPALTPKESSTLRNTFS